MNKDERLKLNELFQPDESDRVYRGGSWLAPVRLVREARRFFRRAPSIRLLTLGFRLVREVR